MFNDFCMTCYSSVKYTCKKSYKFSLSANKSRFDDSNIFNPQLVNCDTVIVIVQDLYLGENIHVKWVKHETRGYNL